MAMFEEAAGAAWKQVVLPPDDVLTVLAAELEAQAASQAIVAPAREHFWRERAQC